MMPNEYSLDWISALLFLWDAFTTAFLGYAGACMGHTPEMRNGVLLVYERFDVYYLVSTMLWEEFILHERKEARNPVQRLAFVM